jgi:hypothetical protein
MLFPIMIPSFWTSRRRAKYTRGLGFLANETRFPVSPTRNWVLIGPSQVAELQKGPGRGADLVTGHVPGSPRLRVVRIQSEGARKGWLFEETVDTGIAKCSSE